MDNLVQFVEKTKELRSLLEKDTPAQERDEYIDKINQLVKDRELFLTETRDLSSLAENEKTELVNLEQEIKHLMLKQKNIIKQDIKTLKLKKQKGNQYANPYENLAADGMFLDKRK